MDDEWQRDSGADNTMKSKMAPSYREQVKLIGFKNTITYFFFQRILRINSHVPWPVHFSSIVTNPEKIERKYYRPYPGYMLGCYIQAVNGIEIGRNVRIGPGVKLISANHDYYNFDRHLKEKKLKIGDNCWIGADAVILPGVTIGENSVVGAAVL